MIIDKIKDRYITNSTEHYKLPGEYQMAEELGCHRNSIHNALIKLELQGFVYSRQRKGWFVTPDASSLANSKTNYIRGKHRTRYTYELLECKIIPANHLSTLFNCSPQRKIVYFERLKKINDSVELVETTYANILNLVDFTPELIEGPLMPIITSSINLGNTFATFCSISCPKNISKYLTLPENSPLSLLIEKTYSETGALVLYSHNYHRSSELNFSYHK